MVGAVAAGLTKRIGRDGVFFWIDEGFQLCPSLGEEGFREIPSEETFLKMFAGIKGELIDAPEALGGSDVVGNEIEHVE